MSASRTAASSSSQPLRRRGLQHGVLAADVVRDQGVVGKTLAQEADHVEVRKGGLHHQEVGAFRHVQRRLAQRFARVGGVHLVAAAVAELRRALRRLAERAVEGRCVLHRVRHDGQVGEPAAVQRSPDGAHHAVDHAAGGHDVRAGLRVREGDLPQDVQRLVVQEVAFRQRRHRARRRRCSGCRSGRDRCTRTCTRR